jgi:hypothetical protein
MSELEELRTWLNSDKRNFDAGLQLYIAYFDDVQMRQYLAAHRPEGKLYELIWNRVVDLKEAINGQNSIALEKNVSTSVRSISSDAKLEVKRTIAIQIDGSKKSVNITAVIAELEKEWKQLQAEKGVWHTQK